MPVNHEQMAEWLTGPEFNMAFGRDAEESMPDILKAVRTDAAKAIAEYAKAHPYAEKADAFREVVRQAVAAVRPQVKVERFRLDAQKKFLAAGGTEAEFRAAWPKLKAEHLAAAATAKEQIAAEHHARISRMLGM